MASSVLLKANMRSGVYCRALDLIFHEIRDRYDFCDLFGHRVIANGVCEYCYRSTEPTIGITLNEEVNIRARELQVMGDIERAVQWVSEEAEVLSRIEEIIRQH